MRKFIFFTACVYAFVLRGQTSMYGIEAQPKGGNEELEQVLQTQLTLPKILLTSNFDKEFIVQFELDSSGKAINHLFETGTNNVLRSELRRIFLFLRFNHLQAAQEKKELYYMVFKLSTEKYQKYFKQKNKNNLKGTFKADSSFVVYSKADKSPDYYKNGEEGLSDFILNEIEYPVVAKEKSIEGTVILDFIVETNGYVTSVVPKKGVSGGCTEEAMRLIKLTRWQPAVYKGKLVRYKITYPITFTLANQNEKITPVIGQ